MTALNFGEGIGQVFGICEDAGAQHPASTTKTLPEPTPQGLGNEGKQFRAENLPLWFSGPRNSSWSLGTASQSRSRGARSSNTFQQPSTCAVQISTLNLENPPQSMVECRI